MCIPGPSILGRTTFRPLVTYDANGIRASVRPGSEYGPVLDDGLRRVMRDANERRIALDRCTPEKEPLECQPYAVGCPDTLQNAVLRLSISSPVRRNRKPLRRYELGYFDMFKLPHDGDMFTSRAEVIADALTRQAQKVAYIDAKTPGRRQPAGGYIYESVVLLGFTKKSAATFFELLP